MTRYTVGRARPFDEQGPSSFNGFKSEAVRSGFASNHVAVAFALATPFAQQYNMPWLYAAAASTGIGRLNDREALDLVFLPGFSTAEVATSVAGRGIGMDVVRSEVNALGGRIETQTQPGQGTSFKLVLPLTTVVTQVVILRAGTRSIETTLPAISASTAAP